MNPRIALDTNVLVRYLAQDDIRQSAAASRLIESLTPTRRAFISLVTLLESTWVMEGRYGANRSDIRAILHDLVAQECFELQEHDAVRDALQLFAQPGVDLHDALMLSLAKQRKAKVLTFDAKAAKKLGMELLVTTSLN